MSDTSIRIDTKSLDSFFEIHIDDNGDVTLYIIDSAGRQLEQTIDLGRIHPIELQNRGVDMMVLSRKLLSRES